MSSSQFIPAEFRGLARSFRQRVDEANASYIKTLNQINEGMRERLARKPSLRDGAVIDIERTIKAINNPYRLALTINTPKRGHLAIADYVIDAAHDRDDAWTNDGWEKTVVIVRVDISTMGGLATRQTPLVTVSSHAIARWYERSGSRDESRLIHDLKLILDAQEPDSAPASHGVWLGKSINAHTEIGNQQQRNLVRLVRTYLSADMIEADQLPLVQVEALA